jgi:hypothetical protein
VAKVNYKINALSLSVTNKARDKLNWYCNILRHTNPVGEKLAHL